MDRAIDKAMDQAMDGTGKAMAGKNREVHRAHRNP